MQSHRERWGRMDVLVNNAGVGIGEAMDEITTKKLDIQLGANLRALIIATRESLPMLKEAGAEHGKALIVNTASIAGKKGQAWLSVYSATKAGVVGFSQATQKEHENDGHPGDRSLPGLRRHADDRVRPRAGRPGGDDPPGGHRRVGALPAAHVAGLPGAGDRLHAARRGALGAARLGRCGRRRRELALGRREQVACGLAAADADRRAVGLGNGDARGAAGGAAGSRRAARARPGSGRRARRSACARTRCRGRGSTRAASRRVRTSRRVARRGRLAPVYSSQARAKLATLVRPPLRWAASIGQTPPELGST